MTNEQTTNEKTTNDLNTNLFPRSTAYDEAWVTANRMGPNVLWLAESIAERMLRAVEREAVDRACIRLTLNNRTDRESYERGFYPREGFRERTDFANFVKPVWPEALVSANRQGRVARIACAGEARRALPTGRSRGRLGQATRPKAASWRSRLTARTPFQATSACSQASGKVPIQLQWSAQAPSSPCVSMTWSSWRSMCSRKLA